MNAFFKQQLSYFVWFIQSDLKNFLEPAMFCHLAVLIYLCGEVRKKGCNCVCPFERKGNWISVNAFLYFNSKVCKRLPKKVPIGK